MVNLTTAGIEERKKKSQATQGLRFLKSGLGGLARNERAALGLQDISAEQQAQLQADLAKQQKAGTAQPTLNLALLQAQQTTPTQTTTQATTGTKYVPGQNQQFTLAPDQTRAEPTVATAGTPLVTVGGTTPSDFASLSDRDKQIQIAYNQVKAAGGYPGLSEEETKYLVGLQFPTTDTSAYTALDDLYAKQIAEGEAGITETEATQKTERETALEAKERQLESQYQQERQKLAQQAQRESEAVQGALSFSGFGRSTYAAGKQLEIEQAVTARENELIAARDLELQIYRQSLEGADAETLSGMRTALSELKQKAAAQEIETAQKIAELNAENQVTGLEALSNLMQGLSTSTQSKVSTDVSNLLGYVADEYGNAVTDAEGNKIPVNKAQGDSNWELYTDDKGDTYFYDPSDPLSTWQKTPGSQGTTYTDAAGNVSSSQSSDSSGVGNAYDFVEQNYGSDFTKWAANCAEFVRKFIPNMPSGNYTKQARQQNIKLAEQQGFGSSDMSTVQAGDAILTGEGEYGHSAIVIERTGDTVTLLESNYKPGQISYGRTLSINDPTIYGWVRATGESIAAPTETARPSMYEQLQSITAGQTKTVTSTQKAQASKIAKDIFGSATEDNVSTIENLYAEGMSTNDIVKLLGGTVDDTPLEERDPEQYQKLLTQATKTDEYKAAKSFVELQNALKSYYDLVSQVGSVSWLDKNTDKVRNAYANLKIKWKEAANLGALTGPDIGAIADAIPNVTSLFSIFRKFRPGDAKDQILDALVQESASLRTNAQRNIDLLSTVYPDLVDSSAFLTLQSESQYYLGGGSDEENPLNLDI